MEKKNLIGLPLTCFLVLSLLMAACAPAPRTTPGPTTQTAPAAPTARTTTVPAEKPAVTPSAQKPKYGGVLKLGKSADIIYFDEVVGVPYSVPTFALTNQNLVEGDWTKGPAGGYGTNETGWGDRLDRWEHKTGFLAENWKLEATPEMGTLTLNIRKGVRWALNPDSEASRLVNGREMTADDVVFSLKTYLTDKRSFIYRSHTLDMVKSFAEGQLKITTPDQWTVKIEMPTAQLEAGVGRFIDNARIVPREVLEKWGANAMADWKKSVGTGPFILTEFTSGSSATLVKNPNFWMKNPVGPGKGDKLPYLDGVKFLIITDKSTYFAALRTAKVDWLGAVNWEDAKELKVSAKQVVSKEYDIGGG
ncbi:MAG: hypothetical protein HYX81_02235, partial [Chloroflexi bacterium]|nr:hypothetical protein [Chloroflexota bacterium]